MKHYLKEWAGGKEMTEKSSWKRDLARKITCYENACPFRKIYGSKPKSIPITEARKCKKCGGHY